MTQGGDLPYDCEERVDASLDHVTRYCTTAEHIKKDFKGWEKSLLNGCMRDINI